MSFKSVLKHLYHSYIIGFYITLQIFRNVFLNCIINNNLITQALSIVPKRIVLIQKLY